MGDGAAGDDDYFIRQLDDTLLVGDDNHGGVTLLMDLFKGLGEAGEAPQVDAGLGLVKDHQLTAAGQDGGNLNALDLAAGEGDVDLAVEIVVGAETHLREIFAALVLAEVCIARGDGQKVAHRDALEARRLLKAVADAEFRTLGDAKVRDVLTVEEDLAARRRDKAHDDLGERRLAAAVGPVKTMSLRSGMSMEMSFKIVCSPSGVETV